MREMKLKELKEKSPTELLAFAEQYEVGTRLTVHDLKAVARQMAFEKAARVRFRLGEEE